MFLQRLRRDLERECGRMAPALPRHGRPRKDSQTVKRQTQCAASGSRRRRGLDAEHHGTVEG
jgi:hypothetical protein